MKIIKYISLAVLILFGATVYAQNTYINDRLITTDQLNGSARFVGMGGAMGALGADLSTISSNPAGIGLYRRNDVGCSFGVIIPNGNGWNSKDKTSYGEDLSRASLDQLGVVFSLRNSDSKLKFINFSFNYQKRKNFNQGFYADNYSLNGLSQMTQLSQIASDIYGSAIRDASGKLKNVPNNLTGLAMFPSDENATTDNYYLKEELDNKGNKARYNTFTSTHSNYSRHQRGALKGYDMNVAFNIDNRLYLGATLGIDQLDYEEWNEYGEFAADDQLNYSLYNDTKIKGIGINGKMGLIVRPIVTNSFRIGLAVETPTWYRMNNSTLYNLDRSTKPESYLEFTLRTPWKMRLSAGQTIGRHFAWGAEYEFVNYAKMKQGYPAVSYTETEQNDFRTADWDVAMNQLTDNTLRGQHTLRIGMEVKPTERFALRTGYNHITSRFKKNIGFDQYKLDSKAMNYATNTEYMRLGSANLLSLGIGYQFKSMYLDMTYEFRAQRGEFYAFDSVEQAAALTPVDVNLNTHQVMFGIGLRF